MLKIVHTAALFAVFVFKIKMDGGGGGVIPLPLWAMSLKTWGTYNSILKENNTQILDLKAENLQILAFIQLFLFI